jgi:hypothetical protein
MKFERSYLNGVCALIELRRTEPAQFNLYPRRRRWLVRVDYQGVDFSGYAVSRRKTILEALLIVAGLACRLTFRNGRRRRNPARLADGR